MTTLEQASQLINLAKQAVGSELSGKTLVIDKAIEKQFSNYLGVFITLKKHGELRGCIGFPLPHYRLYRAMIEAAKAAAFSDPRFSPVVEDELDQISFEISILSVPKKIDINEDNYDKLIKIGRDGLIIRYGYTSGLLLPQVFTEYNCTPLKALQMTCDKAGLPPHAWKDPDATIEIFSGEVFFEQGPGGKIVKEELEN